MIAPTCYPDNTDCAWNYKDVNCDPSNLIDISLYPSCNKTIEDCKKRNNADRFGGFPVVSMTKKSKPSFIEEIAQSVENNLKTKYEYSYTTIAVPHNIFNDMTTAFNAIGGREWNKNLCKCDKDIGFEPCEYCAVFNALNRTEKFLVECSYSMHNTHTSPKVSSYIDPAENAVIFSLSFSVRGKGYRKNYKIYKDAFIDMISTSIIIDTLYEIFDNCIANLTYPRGPQ